MSEIPEGVTVPIVLGWLRLAEKRIKELEAEIAALKAAAPPPGPTCAVCATVLGRSFYSAAPYVLDGERRVGDLCLVCRKALPDGR